MQCYTFSQRTHLANCYDLNLKHIHRESARLAKNIDLCAIEQNFYQERVDSNRGSTSRLLNWLFEKK